MSTPDFKPLEVGDTIETEWQAESPVLPDKWIDGDVIRHCDSSQGTWVRTGRKWHNCERRGTGRVFDDDWATRVIVNGYGKVLHANRESAVASLPPAPVWSVISTDEDQPTLARVTFGSDFTTTRLVFRDDHFVYDADSAANIGRLDYILRVELLHTHNPETHVPVDREVASHPHMGPDDTDATMLNVAADRIEMGYVPGGSNAQQTVVRVLRAVSAALADGAGTEGSDDE